MPLLEDYQRGIIKRSTYIRMCITSPRHQLGDSYEIQLPIQGVSESDVFTEAAALILNEFVSISLSSFVIVWTQPELLPSYSAEAVRGMKVTGQGYLYFALGADNLNKTQAQPVEPGRLTGFYGMTNAEILSELGRLTGARTCTTNISKLSVQWLNRTTPAAREFDSVTAAVTQLRKEIAETLAKIPAPTPGAATNHTHPVSQIEQLVAELDNLAEEINDRQLKGNYVLQPALDEAIATLLNWLDEKQPVGNYALAATMQEAVSNLQKAIDQKAPAANYALQSRLDQAISDFSRELDTKQSSFIINAADYGAKGDLVYQETSYNTVAIVSGTDTTAKIQAALNAAGAMVPQDVNLPYEGAVRVVIPPGKYIIAGDKGLDIPSNVIFDSEGAVFFNFLNNDWEPIIKGRRHSHATKIKVHANKKTGIEWGDRTGGGVRCDSYIDAIWVEHAGVEYESTLPPNRQKCGLRIFGLWFRIGRIEIKEANIGLDVYQASDVLCPAVFLMGCSTACRMESAEQILFPSVALDTNISTGFQIDNSGNVLVTLTAFVNSDGYGTAMDTLLRIGQYSGTPCKDIYINAAAISIGGRMLSIANCMDSAFTLFASNARLFSQTSGNGQATSHWNTVNWASASGQVNGGGLKAHDIGTNYQPYGNEGSPSAAIAYGANLSGFLKIDLLASAGINPAEGKQYGLLTVNGQNWPIIIVPKVSRSLYTDNSPANPSYGDVWEASNSSGDGFDTERWTFNGEYWVSQRRIANWSFNNIASAANFFELLDKYPNKHGILFEWFTIGMKTGASNSASAYATFTLSRRDSSGISSALSSFTSSAIAASGRLYSMKDLKISFTNDQAVDAVIALTLTGAPGAMSGSASFSYRYTW